MDTFFAMSKGRKSSRGDTCYQLLVTDKGFIYVVPMKRKSEVLQAVKQFSNKIGARDAIVCDIAGGKCHQALNNFATRSGLHCRTTLQALEEGTPWVNKTELCIKLMKEAVCKDMCIADSPLVF